MAFQGLSDFISDAIQYITAAFPQVNVSPGTVLSSIIASFANINYQLQFALNSTQNDQFIATAVGTALDSQAFNYGLRRNTPTFASGSVTLTRTDTTTSQTVAQGSKFGTVALTLNDIITFTSTAPVTFAIGQNQIAVNVACDSSGTQGNVGVGTINVIITPIQGVVSVTNGTSLTGGTDRENDDSLRQRIVLSLQPQNSLAAIKAAVLGVNGITTAAVFDQQDHLGNFLVYAADPTGTLGSLTGSVQTAVLAAKSLGTNPSILNPTVTFCNVNYTFAVQPGYVSASVQQVLENTIKTYFSGLGVGQTFRPFDLVGLIIGSNVQAFYVPGLLDFYITSTSIATLYIPKPWECVKLGVLTGTFNSGEIS